MRPISEELIEQTTKDVMSLAMWLNNTESEFYDCIYKLTVQSLRAALSDTEIEHFASIISWSAMQKNSNKTYFELSRTL